MLFTYLGRRQKQNVSSNGDCFICFCYLWDPRKVKSNFTHDSFKIMQFSSQTIRLFFSLKCWFCFKFFTILTQRVKSLNLIIKCLHHQEPAYKKNPFTNVLKGCFQALFLYSFFENMSLTVNNRTLQMGIYQGKFSSPYQNNTHKQTNQDKPANTGPPLEIRRRPKGDDTVMSL